MSSVGQIDQPKFIGGGRNQRTWRKLIDIQGELQADINSSSGSTDDPGSVSQQHYHVATHHIFYKWQIHTSVLTAVRVKQLVNQPASHVGVVCFVLAIERTDGFGKWRSHDYSICGWWLKDNIQYFLFKCTESSK